MKIVSGFDLHCYELSEYTETGVVKPLAIVFGNTPAEAEDRAAMLGAAYDMYELIKIMADCTSEEDRWLSKWTALKQDIEPRIIEESEVSEG